MSHKHSAQASAAALLGEKTQRATGSGAVDFELPVTSRTRILQFKIGTDAAPSASETLVLSIENATLGSYYGCTVLATDMQDATSVFFNEPMYLEPGDSFKVQWVNSDSVNWGITVNYADLGVN